MTISAMVIEAFGGDANVFKKKLSVSLWSAPDNC